MPHSPHRWDDEIETRRKSQGASRHDSGLPAQSYSAEPHGDRCSDHTRRKIARMQHEVKDTDKIG